MKSVFHSLCLSNMSVVCMSPCLVACCRARDLWGLYVAFMNILRSTLPTSAANRPVSNVSWYHTSRDVHTYTHCNVGQQNNSCSGRKQRSREADIAKIIIMCFPGFHLYLQEKSQPQCSTRPKAQQTRKLHSISSLAKLRSWSFFFACGGSSSSHQLVPFFICQPFRV